MQAAGLGLLPASWCRPGFLASVKKLNETARSLSCSNHLHFAIFPESNATNFIKETTSYYSIISFKFQTGIMTQHLLLEIICKITIGALFTSADSLRILQSCQPLKATGCCHALCEQRCWYHRHQGNRAGVQTRHLCTRYQGLNIPLVFSARLAEMSNHRNVIPIDGKPLTTYILAL